MRKRPRGGSGEKRKKKTKKERARCRHFGSRLEGLGRALSWEARGRHPPAIGLGGDTRWRGTLGGGAKVASEALLIYV
eukprot:9389692-Alexandrium_andersonii.AAC.1